MSSSPSPQLVLVYNTLASVGVGSLPGSLHFVWYLFTPKPGYVVSWRAHSITALALRCGLCFVSLYVTTVLLAHSACPIGYTKQQM